MFWKSKKQESKIILGMIMLQDERSFNSESFLADYNESFDSKVEGLSGNDGSVAFTIDGETLAIGYMPVPIPKSDIEGAARYAYNWLNVLEEVKEQNSHLIVSVMGGSEDAIKRYKIFTQVCCSLLRAANAIGVYMGNQSLLIPKQDYLGEAAFMGDDYLPLNLWVYFGLQAKENGNSGYTYGLREFGKTEMEVLNSLKSLEDIRGLLFNIAHYVLEYDVIFEDGQTCGLSEEEKIPINLSKGSFVAGESFKLVY